MMAGEFDLYDQEIDRLANQQQAKLGASLATSADASPDEEAFLLKLSQKTGIPVEGLRADKGAQARRLDLSQQVEGLSTTAPAAAQFFAEPDNARLAHDDLPLLSTLEPFIKQGPKSALSFAGEADKATARKVRSVGSAFVSGLSASPEMAGESMANLGVMTADFIDYALRPFADDLGMRQAVADVARQSRDFWAAEAKRKAPQQKAGTAEEYFRQAGSNIGLSLSAAPYGVAGEAAALGMFGLTAGDNYEELRQSRQSVPAAVALSLSSRTMEGLTEKIGLDRLYNGTGPVIRKAMGFVFGDLAGEEINTLYSALQDKITVRPDMTMADVVQQVVDTAIVTAIAGPVQGVSMAGAARVSEQLHLDYVEQQKAQRNQDFMTALGSTAEASKLRARMPEKFKELVAKIKEGGEVESVFFGANEWRTFWQERGQDPAEMAASVGVRDYAEALELGSDIAVPLEDYATTLAASEYHADLLQDARLHQGDMTPREAEAFRKDEAARYAALVEEVQREGDPAADESAQRVYEDVLGELLGAGRERTTAEQEAALWRARYQARSARTGVDAWELYQQSPVRVRRPLPSFMTRTDLVDTTIDPLLDRLRAGDVPTDAQIYGKSVVEFLRDVGVSDDRGDLRSMDIDRQRKPFSKKMLRTDGVSLDRAGEMLWEAGYFDDRPTTAEILEAVRNEQSGAPLFSRVAVDEQAQAQRQNLDEMRQYLDSVGVDIESLSNVEVRDLLARSAELEDVTGVEGYEQGGPLWLEESRLADEGAKQSLSFALKKYFGVTKNPFEAGYILPDGSMLDLSGRHYATDHPSFRGQRNVDHRELFTENNDGYTLEEVLPDRLDGSDAMAYVMAVSGAMRVDLRSAVASSIGQPTQKQISILGEALKGGELTVSYVNPQTGKIVDEAEINNVNPLKIKRFYESAATKSDGYSFYQSARGIPLASVASEALPESTTGLLPSKSEQGKYYRATAAGLRAHLERHGDGFLYRVMDIRGVQDGRDVGRPDYRHDFKGTKVKTYAFASHLDDVKKILSERIAETGEQGYIVYRVRPEHVGDGFAVQIPSDRIDGKNIYVHSAVPASIRSGKLDVLYRNGEWLEAANADDVRGSYQGYDAEPGRDVRSDAGAGREGRSGADAGTADRVTFYQDGRLPRLSVLHSLSSDNLIFADKMGGLAAPSLAVVREGMAMEGYGDITLIGTRDLADPEKVPVFDADAYSATFPRAEYPKVPTKTAQKVVDRFQPFMLKYDGNRRHVDTIWDNAVNSPDPARSISDLLRANSMKAAFLAEKGETVEPVQREKRVRYEWMNTRAWKSFVEGMDNEARDLAWGDPRRQAQMVDAAEAVRAGVDEYLAALDAPDEIKDDLRETYIADVIDPVTGAMYFGPFDRSTRETADIGKLEIDTTATGDVLDAALAGRESEFKAWLDDVIGGMYGEPFLKVDGKKADYTLQNIVKVMTSGKVQAKEKTMTFGEGKARAAASFQFRTLETMRQYADEIVPPKDLEAAREKAKQMMSDWRDDVIEYYTERDWKGNVDVWNGLDASMRAIAKFAKSGRSAASLKAALQKEGFRGVPDRVIKAGVAAGDAMLTAPVPYFEAKPQRAVMLEEFAGAVIPTDASPAVRDILDRHGIRYEEYGNKHDEEARAAAVEKLRGELSREGRDTLFQRRPEGKRGSITFGSRFRDIVLLEKADLSTFLHESGHAWLEELRADAAREGAPAQLVEDWQTIAAWAGIDPNGMISVEAHEQFARAVEAYVMEGKAPSVALQPVFQRFRAWLVRIYRSLSALDVQLTDEVRGVMDRLFATDEEIAQAQQVQALSPLFADAAAAGMTEREFAIYRADAEKAHAEAAGKLQAKLMKELARENLKWWKDERAKMLAEVEAEVQAQPVYQAIQLLTKGKNFDGDPAPDGFKLSKDALVRTYGKAFVKSLPRSFRYAYTTGEGLHPDVAADLLGFASGDELVRAMANAAPMKQVVEAETDVRMRQKYGDLLNDGSLADVAMAAVHNDAQGSVLRAELRALKRKQRQARPAVAAALADAKAAEAQARQEMQDSIPPLEMFKMWAAQAVGAKQIGELRPDLYLKAEQKAAREAIEAAGKNDFVRAGEAKQRQLLNHYLYMEAVAARDEVDKNLDHFRAYFKPLAKQAKGRNMDLVQAARAVLSAYGIGPKNADKSALAQLALVQKYNPQLFADLQMAVDVAMQDSKPYKRLTLDEFRAMRDGVENLMHLARRDRVAEIDGEKLEIEEIVAELTAELATAKKRKTDAAYATASSGEKISLKFAGVVAAARRVESWVSARDGGKPGPFRRYIWQPVSDAAVKYRLAKSDTIKRFRDLFAPVEASLHTGEIAAPELGQSGSTFRNKAELLMALLHTGNASNKKKLLVGRGWGAVTEFGGQEGLDSYAWDGFIRRMWAEGVLTKADYDFAQGVWDLLEELKPAAQAAHREMYGYYFDEITASEVNTPWGVYRGGYVPAVTDPFRVQDQANREDIESYLAENQTSMFPSPARGFTMARVEYNKPLSLDMHLLPAHIDKVLKFVHLAAPVRDVAKIVMNRDFRDAMHEVNPATIDDMLMPWLNRSGRQTLETKNTGWAGKAVDDVARSLRRRTGMQLMALNVANTIQQFTGISLSLEKVGAPHFARALWHYARQPKTVADMVASKSGYMLDRKTGETHRMMGEINQLLDTSKLKKVQDFAMQHGYVLQLAAQNMVDYITWLGAYNQAVAEGQDETAAVRAADSAVRETQGSFEAEDISRLETGTARARLFTQFMSYFNMQANLLGTRFQNIVAETGWKGGAPRLFLLYVTGFMLPAVLSEIIMRGAAGRLGDDDDDGEYWDDLFAAWFGGQWKTGLAMVPGGQVITAAANRFNKNPSDDRLSISPAVAALESIGGAAVAGAKLIDEGEMNRQGVKDALTALGLATGLPLGAVARPVGYGVALSRGDTEPSGPLDVARGFVTGYAPRP